MAHWGAVAPKTTKQNIERLLCWVTAGVKSLNTTDLEERCFEFVTFVPRNAEMSAVDRQLCTRVTVSCSSVVYRHNAALQTTLMMTQWCQNTSDVR